MIVAGVKLQAASVLAATAHASESACWVPKFLVWASHDLPSCRRVTVPAGGGGEGGGGEGGGEGGGGEGGGEGGEGAQHVSPPPTPIGLKAVPTHEAVAVFGAQSGHGHVCEAVMHALPSDSQHLWPLAQAPEHVLLSAVPADESHPPRLVRAQRGYVSAVLVAVSCVQQVCWGAQRPSEHMGVNPTEETGAVASQDACAYGNVLSSSSSSSHEWCELNSNWLDDAPAPAREGGGEQRV